MIHHRKKQTQDKYKARSPHITFWTTVKFLAKIIGKTYLYDEYEKKDSRFKSFIKKSLYPNLLQIAESFSRSTYYNSLETTVEFFKWKRVWNSENYDAIINRIDPKPFFRYIEANYMRALAIAFLIMICLYYAVSYLFRYPYNPIGIHFFFGLNLSLFIYFMVQVWAQDWTVFTEHLLMQKRHHGWTNDEYQARRHAIAWKRIWGTINHKAVLLFLLGSCLVFFIESKSPGNLADFGLLFHLYILGYVHFYILAILVSSAAIIIDNHENDTISFRILWFFILFLIGCFINLFCWGLFVLAINTQWGLFLIWYFQIIYTVGFITLYIPILYKNF
jgi:hypothetical protein